MLCQLIQKNSSNICYKCAKTAWNVTFWTKKKVKEKDSNPKSSTPVGQIDRKKRKKKIWLLPKWFANSFRKNPPICAGNVPKTAWNVTYWTKRKFTEKDGDLKICPPVGPIDHKNVKNIDKLLSNWFDQSFRKKTSDNVLKMCQNGQKCYFLNQKKVKQKDSKDKNSSL